MKKIVVTGKTIELAVKSGLSQWQVSEDRVNIHILEQPSREWGCWVEFSG